MAEIRQIPYGSDAYRESCAIREAVLRTPLGMTLRPEDVLTDSERLHFGGWENGTMLGSVTLVRHDGYAQIKHMAVLDAARGKGIGAELMVAAEAAAKLEGFDRIMLDARETAVPFYKKLGYKIVGDMFIQVTLPHYKMEKKLA